MSSRSSRLEPPRQEPGRGHWPVAMENDTGFSGAETVLLQNRGRGSSVQLAISSPERHRS